jgi:hypothetical protein
VQRAGAGDELELDDELLIGDCGGDGLQGDELRRVPSSNDSGDDGVDEGSDDSGDESSGTVV